MMKITILTALLVLPAAAGFAMDGEGVRDNFDTAARNHVASKSTGDVWALKQRGTKKALRLALVGTERDTVRRVGGGRYEGLIDFKDAKGKGHYWAVMVADLSTDLFEVRSWRWLTKTEAEDLRSDFTRESRKLDVARVPGPFGLMPDVWLPLAGGGEEAADSCPKPKCLVVYVAPWCPHCREATAMIQALPGILSSKGVPVRVIVGADTEAKIRDYARSFGPKTLLDLNKKGGPKGVPHFRVIDPTGAVLAEVQGAPRDLNAEKFAAEELGL